MKRIKSERCLRILKRTVSSYKERVTGDCLVNLREIIGKRRRRREANVAILSISEVVMTKISTERKENG